MNLDSHENVIFPKGARETSDNFYYSITESRWIIDQTNYRIVIYE